MLDQIHHDGFHTLPGTLLWMGLTALGVLMTARGTDPSRWDGPLSLAGVLLGASASAGVALESPWPGLGLLLAAGPAVALIHFLVGARGRRRSGLPVLGRDSSSHPAPWDGAGP